MALNIPGPGVTNVLQTTNQILTQLLAAIKTLAPTTLIGGGPQAAQTLTGNGQTIHVGTNGSVIITNTTGNLTGLILAQGTVPTQRFTIMNVSSDSLTFASAGTSNVYGTPTISANTAQSFEWDSTNSLWRAT